MSKNSIIVGCSSSDKVTDVPEERIASIFKVEKYSKQEYVPPKRRWTSTELKVVAPQKIVFFIVTL
jgi:hypothetical protein